MPTIFAPPDLFALAASFKRKAADLGFTLVGMAPAHPSRYRAYLERWLAEGKAGEMEYLHRRLDERTDVGHLLPGARSVICVAMNYHVPLAPSESPQAEGRVARYALGDDYHEVIKPRLYDLADFIRATVPGAQTRCGVDTAPVMEKELAARAGIGWIGKNTNVINPHIGSWILLGEVITTLDLPVDEPAVDRCGTCRRCLDACPTGAITAPYELDARRCISYLTIEHRGAITTDLAGQMGNWLYGCDICQDVCPWNSKAVDSPDPTVQPRFPSGGVAVEDVLTWDEPTYFANTRHAATRRVKLPQFVRNATIVQANARGSSMRSGPEETLDGFVGPHR